MGDPSNLRVLARVPLSPRELEILITLYRQDRHGYALTRRLAERADRGVKLAMSTVYATLQRLEQDDLVVEIDRSTSRAQGPPRRYLTVTPFGRVVLRAKCRRLRELSREMRELELC